MSHSLRQALLPRNAPRVEGYDIGAGTMIDERGRAATVWDWLTLEDGRTALATLWRPTAASCARPRPSRVPWTAFSTA